MSFRSKLLSILFIPSLLLVGCGGGDDFKIGNGDNNLGGESSNNDGSSDGGTGGSSGGDSENTSTVSYYPLSVYERYKSFSGYSSDGVFQGDFQYPLIDVLMINPINASTLLPVENAMASDYKVTVDDIDIDPSEAFPLLQKVVGMPVQLKTALVFDTSNSMDLTTAEYNALKAEVKSYIDKAKAHSNPIIANQKFVVWSFDEDATDLSQGFSNSDVFVKGIIDTVAKNTGSSSNLHKAIVKVVGRYIDNAATPPINFDTDGPNQDPNDFLDNRNESDNDDDLVDEVKNDGVYLTQMVLFSSGSDSKLEFTQAKMLEAIKSQGFLSYEPVDSSESDSDTSTDNYLSKPVFYYVTGGSTEGDTYQALSDAAEETVSLTAVNGAYTFSDALIESQLSAIDKRINLDNQYVFRYAFLPRQGDHTAVFSSKTTAANFSLTTTYKADFFTALGYTGLGTPYNELSSLVEVTGPNGEYLPGNMASLSQVSTFMSATRWTTDSYDAVTDYTWSLVNGTGSVNADGSYTVSSISGASAQLTLTNTARGGETAVITITN